MLSKVVSSSGSSSDAEKHPESGLPDSDFGTTSNFMGAWTSVDWTATVSCNEEAPALGITAVEDVFVVGGAVGSGLLFLIRFR